MQEPYTITHDNTEYARIFSANMPIIEGACFLSHDADPLQVGILERKKGYEVPAHMHNPRSVDLACPGEFLLIQKGKISIEILSKAWDVIATITLEQGDCILLINGGHRVVMEEDTRILEVKQGPYLGRDQEKSFSTS